MTNTRPLLGTLVRTAVLVGCLALGCGNSAWHHVDTEHLRIHYRPGSMAAKQLTQVKQIYERTYQAARRFVPAQAAPVTIDVYLYDELLERAYAEPERMTVHLMYGPRYRLTSLHEFLVVMLAPLNPDAPPGVREGLFQSQSKLRYAMQRRLEDRNPDSGKRWPPRPELPQLIEQPADNAETRMLAGALVRFLLAELGEEEFWNLYNSMTLDNWEEKLAASLKRDLDSVAADLRTYIISRTELVPGVQ